MTQRSAVPRPNGAKAEVPDPGQSARAIWLAFAAVVGSFFVTNFIVLRETASVNGYAASISDTSSPSIELLSSIRRSVLLVELELERLSSDPPPSGPLSAVPTAQRAAEGLDELRRAVRAYLQIQPLPEDRAMVQLIDDGWVRFDRASREALTVLATPPNDANVDVPQEVIDAGDALLTGTARAIELNAGRGREAAERIREVRQRSVWGASVLNGVCGLLALVLVRIIQRQLAARRTIVEAHTRFLEEQAEELELFTGRVAHDIRNPLSAARLSAELAARKSSEADVRARIEAAIRSLSRADLIITGLLDFARSGARPDPGARSEPRAVISDLLPSLLPEAEEARVTLTHEPIPPVLVSCSTGVYLSLVANLVRNAIKYMGDSPLRNVTVRVRHARDRVLTEVVDTGPGIPAESQRALFEPWFRSHRGGEGLGLGLATVKKLAEGHGGRVGVHSEPGSGSTFFFELPYAGPAVADSRPEGSVL